VRGYKDLNIDIYLSAATLRPYVNITYTKKHDNHDDITEILTQHFGKECMP
jgi:hypothetical protein